MFYEVRDAADNLLERVDYQYEVERNHAGNPTYIVRRVVDPQGPDTFYATTLQYNQAGELWFIGQQTWPGGGDCFSRELLSLHEFRSQGRAMRMTRERDPNRPSEPIAGSTVWHEYSGDSIYLDVRIDEPAGNPLVMTELAAFEPGLGQVDLQAQGGPATAYAHGDQIGSARLLTDAGAEVARRIVYTAFGEPVHSDGTVGTRYQYAGAWGYQSGLYDAAGPHGAGSPGDFASAVPFLHVGHRWYDPSTGRFLQRDPIGIEGGLNVYAYVKSRPTTGTDPEGLTSLPPFPPGIDPPPGVKPRLGFRRDIDYLDGFSIAHFCIPAYLSSKTSGFGQKAGFALSVGVVLFEFCEPDLRKIDESLYYETQQNIIGDILVGWLGILVGPVLFFYEARARRGRKRDQSR